MTRSRFLTLAASLLAAPFAAVGVAAASTGGGRIITVRDDVPVMLTGGYVMSRAAFERANRRVITLGESFAAHRPNHHSTT